MVQVSEYAAFKTSNRQLPVVKEVVTGEDGRSQPSLSELFGAICECVELDVLEILTSEGEKIPEPKRPLPFGHIV